MKIGVRVLTVVACAVPVILFSGVAAAAKPPLRKISTTYELYVGEMRFAHAEAQTMFDALSYRLTGQAQTIGAWAALLPWEATMASSGKMIDGNVMPQHFAATTQWRQQPKSMTIDYMSDGSATYAKESSATPKHTERLDRAMIAKSYDPLSGTLQMLMQVSGQENCRVAAKIFDGKNHIEVKAQDLGAVTLSASNNNAYAGVARQCVLTFKDSTGKKLAGQTNAIATQDFWGGSGNRPPITVWLARLRPDLPLVPVRAETTCPLGVVTAQLADWTRAGKADAPELFARVEPRAR